MSQSGLTAACVSEGNFSRIVPGILKRLTTLTTKTCSAEMASTGGLANIFTYSNLVHAVSGAAGSAFAISVFYPLDTVRTRLQVDDHRESKNTLQMCRDILNEEGLEGLYRGWYPVVTALCCSNFVYFYTFNGLKSVIRGNSKKSSPLADLSLGFVSGVINVLVTTPLWVANTRLKLQGANLHTSQYKKEGKAKVRYDGIIDCILKIINDEGIQKLWGGTVPSLLLATNPAIHFMLYEALKRYFKKSFNAADLSATMYFVIGAIAKAVATVITYPLQIIQSRLRAGYAKQESTQSLMENVVYMIKTKGFLSLYKGLESKLLQTVLTAALMFLTYEKIAASIFKMMGM